MSNKQRIPFDKPEGIFIQAEVFGIASSRTKTAFCGIFQGGSHDRAVNDLSALMATVPSLAHST